MRQCLDHLCILAFTTVPGALEPSTDVDQIIE